MPKPYPSSADTEAMVERVAPAVLDLLGDGVPRSRRAIVAALAEHHPKDELRRTLMRLAVTEGLAGHRSLMRVKLPVDLPWRHRAVPVGSWFSPRSASSRRMMASEALAS